MRNSRKQEPAGWPKALVLAITILGMMALGATATFVGAGFSTTSQASPQAQAGAPGLVQLHLARASRVRDSLGFPVGTSRTDSLVHDSVRRTDIDETDELDAQGKTVSLTQFDSNGDFVSAIRFDAQPHPSASVSSSSASASARTAAINLGLESTQPSLVFDDPSDGGRMVQWDRAEQGVPVLGDGTLVRVWPDGRVASVSKVGHVLSTPPSVTIGAGQARQQATLSLGQLAANSNPADFSIQAPELEWVNPNTAFDNTQPYSEDPTMRLAWVVNVQTSGATAGYLTLLTFYFDAGDGTLIGGDEVQ